MSRLALPFDFTGLFDRVQCRQNFPVEVIMYRQKTNKKRAGTEVPALL
jgi:hypothetical protein